METKKLYKDPHNKKLSGVCGGIAKYFGIDPTLVRLGWVMLTLFTTVFPGVIAYIIFACVMDYEPMDQNYQGNGQYNNNPPTYYNPAPAPDPVQQSPQGPQNPQEPQNPNQV